MQAESQDVHVPSVISERNSRYPQSMRQKGSALLGQLLQKSPDGHSGVDIFEVRSLSAKLLYQKLYMNPLYKLARIVSSLDKVLTSAPSR